MQSSNSAPLSIARHVMQFIWQTSLSSHDHNIIGLLGSQERNKISHATHMPLWQALTADEPHDVMQLTQNKESLHKLNQSWQANNTFLTGVYQCLRPNLQNMQATEKQLSPYFKHHHNIPFVHLTISFDTKGVLESEAWVIQHGQATQIPMLLTEDRQTALKS